MSGKNLRKRNTSIFGALGFGGTSSGQAGHAVSVDSAPPKGLNALSVDFNSKNPLTSSKDGKQGILRQNSTMVATKVDETVNVISSNMDDYTDEQVLEMYKIVLESLLFPPHVQENLIMTQTKEKKWQTIQMQKHVLKTAKKTGEFGDQERLQLKNLMKVRLPDIQEIIKLRSSLATANRMFLQGFLDHDGIQVLMKLIKDRIVHQPMTHLDAALVFEYMSCCKILMNNDLGMEGFIFTPGAIEIIAKSLMFEWKPIALIVLEILSVCCYYRYAS